MRIATTIGVLLAMSAAAQAETLYYGSRAGMEVTVVHDTLRAGLPVLGTKCRL
jgi:hypothetical protein